MYTRVFTAQIQPGKLDQAIDMYRQLEPSFQQQKGFLGGTLRVDRATNKVVGVANFETRADLEALETSEWYKKMFAKESKQLLVGQPTTESYEVVQQIQAVRQVGGA